jgi:hypothetical protein
MDFTCSLVVRTGWAILQDIGSLAELKRYAASSGVLSVQLLMTTNAFWLAMKTAPLGCTSGAVLLTLQGYSAALGGTIRISTCQAEADIINQTPMLTSSRFPLSVLTLLLFAELVDFQGRWERWENRCLVFQGFHWPSFPRLNCFAGGVSAHHC